jgi:hypothetical protein
MTQSQPATKRRRRQPKQNRFVRVVREMPELIWMGIALLGLALFTVYPRAREAVFEAADRAAATVAPAARSLGERIAGAADRLTPPEVLGIALFVLAMAVLVYRLRWRVIHSPAYSAVSCPRCSGEIHRVHRHAFDRAVNWLVPVRRYRCWNQACGWEGLRVSTSHGQSAPPSKRPPS